MTELIESAEALMGRYRAVLCDLWGCYHDGLRPNASAVARLTAYRRAGGIVLLLTNAPRPVGSVRAFLDRIGAPPESYDAIMSSGEACARAMATGAHGRRMHYVGPERDRHMLEAGGAVDAPLAEADAILCTGLRDDRSEVPEDYAAEVRDWVAAGLPMLCANPDIVVDRGEERLWCAGALARDFETGGGTVISFGKPHLPVYDACMAALADLAGGPLARLEVLAIGDGLPTDISGAAAAGVDALFVTSGIHWQDLGPAPDRPEPAKVEALLRTWQLAPVSAMATLA